MGESGLDALTREIAKHRKRMDAAHKKHIFEGDFKGEGMPTGFHSKFVGSDTHEAYGTKTPVANVGGVYQQSVRSKKDPSKKKENQSTFFPDSATDEHDRRVTGLYGVAKPDKTVRCPKT